MRSIVFSDIGDPSPLCGSWVWDGFFHRSKKTPGTSSPPTTSLTSPQRTLLAQLGNIPNWGSSLRESWHVLPLLGHPQNSVVASEIRGWSFDHLFGLCVCISWFLVVGGSSPHFYENFIKLQASPVQIRGLEMKRLALPPVLGSMLVVLTCQWKATPCLHPKMMTFLGSLHWPRFHQFGGQQ